MWHDQIPCNRVDSLHFCIPKAQSILESQAMNNLISKIRKEKGSHKYIILDMYTTCSYGSIRPTVKRKGHVMRIKRLKSKNWEEQLHSCLWKRFLPLESEKPKYLTKGPIHEWLTLHISLENSTKSDYHHRLWNENSSIWVSQSTMGQLCVCWEGMRGEAWCPTDGGRS